MPYKLVRSSFASWVKSLSVVAIAAALLAAPNAWSALTIFTGNSTGANTGNGVGNNAWYPSSPINPLFILDPTAGATISQPIDLTASLVNNNLNTSSLLLFNVYSTLTSFSGYTAGTNRLVLMAFVTQGSNQKPIPIAWYNSAPGGSGAFQQCSGANCDLQQINNTSYYFGVPYIQNQTVQVGIFAEDICALYGGSAAPTGCTGTSVTAPSATALTSIPIEFDIAVVPGTFNNSPPSANPVNQIDYNAFVKSNPGTGWTFLDTQTYAINFQNQGSTLACPAPTVLSRVYFPDDQKVYLTTTAFSVTPFASGAAPASNLLITDKTSSAKGGPTPDDSQGGFTSNYFGNAPIGSPSYSLGGFTNSTTTSKTYYNLGFLVRDAAGFVAPDTTDTCVVFDVQTADVRAFLQDSKCFIATAAFRSGESAPVLMLRQFRDQFLMRFGLGQGFVKLYYRWSPPAADWLIDHPGFRYPVLLALVPVQLIAWLCLRPIILLSLMAGTFALLLMLRKRNITDAPQA